MSSANVAKLLENFAKDFFIHRSIGFFSFFMYAGRTKHTLCSVFSIFGILKRKINSYCKKYFFAFFAIFLIRKVRQLDEKKLELSVEVFTKWWPKVLVSSRMVVLQLLLVVLRKSLPQMWGIETRIGSCLVPLRKAECCLSFQKNPPFLLPK